MAAEEGIQLGRVIKSVSSAPDAQKQAEILNNAFSRVSIRQAADYWFEIADKALDDLSYAKALLTLLDVPTMTKVTGKKAMGQLVFTFKSTDKYIRLVQIFEKISRLDVKSVKVIKAKAAMMFQFFYLVTDRIVEEGLPKLKIHATDVVNRILDDPQASDKLLHVNLNNYGRAYWSIMIDQLKEGDFRSKDEVVYEVLLNDSLINQYEAGSILASAGAGGEGDARLSDAVMSRLGTNIIKRLNLLLRTTQMYQSADHPSVSAALESLLSTIENAMQGRESLTFTRLGSDLLIDDIKLKQKAKFIEDFVQALEERNVNSMTLKSGLSLEEVRVFLLLFAETQAQIRKRGGVKTILDGKGVSHILVDQFKYGIIADDQKDEADQVASDDKMLENIVFTEIVAKIRKGDLGEMNATEIGAAFKELISGQFAADKSARKSLAQMILALDPELAEEAVFSKAGVRDEMSWSTARKMIDKLLDDLDKGSADDRIHVLDNLQKMGELAITKNKETTLVVIIDKMTERLRTREKDLDVLAKTFEVMGTLARFLILNGKYVQALKILRTFVNLRNYCENLPAERKNNFTRSVCELSANALQSASTSETIDALIREFEGDQMNTVDNSMRILETLGTEQVISSLLDAFTNPSRSVRNRCFQVLTSIGEKSLVVCSWKLRNLNDPSQFPRLREGGEMSDEAYYVARNAIDITAKLGGERELELLREVSDDPDPRVRIEALSAMTKINKHEAAILAKLRLHDSDGKVVEGAINILGQLAQQDTTDELIDLFYAEPALRPSIINALGRIGGDEAEKLLIGATRFYFGGNVVKIFRDSDELRHAALKALGNIGRETARANLRRFNRRVGIFFLRLFFVPLRFKRKEALKISRDAFSRIELRMTKG